MFKIFVGNLGFDTTEQKLRKIFEPHIEIEDLVIARDAESGKSKGYGFVMTRDRIRGRRAVEQVGKFYIDGRRAYVKEAHNKKPGSRGRGGDVRGRRRLGRRSSRPLRRGMRGSAGGPSTSRPTSRQAPDAASGDNGVTPGSNGRASETAADPSPEQAVVSGGYVGLADEQGNAVRGEPGNVRTESAGE